jgi:hypothetical protein
LSSIDPINAVPYDRDGDPGFSNAELTNIQEIWQNVSEDYAPFDVDVNASISVLVPTIPWLLTVVISPLTTLVSWLALLFKRISGNP